MSVADIYTLTEITTWIKAIDLKLNKGIVSSELDTGQAEQIFRLSPAQLKEQRNYWVRMYRLKSGCGGGLVSLQPNTNKI
jgi:hypothetical protein